MIEKMSKKIINIILSVIYFVFALVQLNDPDAIVWFFIYAIVSFICLYSNFKTISKKILVIVIILLLGYATYHLHYFWEYLQIEDKEEIFGKMVYKRPYLEGSREFLGLILATLGVLYQLKKPKETKWMV